MRRASFCLVVLFFAATNLFAEEPTDFSAANRAATPSPSNAKFNSVVQKKPPVLAKAGQALTADGTGKSVWANVKGAALDSTPSSSGMVLQADGNGGAAWGIINASALSADLTLAGTTTGTFSGDGAGLSNINLANVEWQVANSQLVNSSLTVTAGTGLSGRGPVSLGGNVTLSLAAGLALGGTTTGTFSGDGAGLTNLNPANLAGQIANAQLANSSLTVTAGTGLSGGGSVTLGGNVSLALASDLTLAGTTNGAFNGTFNGTFNGNAAGLTGFNASNLTGIVGLANGGTGLNVTAPASGSYLRGTGAAWDVSAIVASDLPAALSNTAFSINSSAGANTTNVATGTTTGAVAIGGGANTVAINSANWSISSAGTASGVALAANALTGTTLSNGVTSSSLTSVGTLTGLTVAGDVSLASGAANNTITLGSSAGDGISMLGTLRGAAPLVFEGATVDANRLTLAVTDPTATRTVTLPDASGTVVTTGNLSAITSTGTLSSVTSTGTITTSGNISTTGTGTITSAGLLTVSSAGANINGTCSATAFSGDGSAVTNLNGANVASGTIPEARLGVLGGIYSGRINGLAASGIDYGAANGTSTANATESNVYVLSPARQCSISNFIVKLDAAPGTGKTRQFYVMVNGAEANLVVISGSATSGSNTGQAYLIAAGSTLSIQEVIIGAATGGTTALFSFEVR